MKSIGEVKHKLNQVRFRHLKKLLDASLKQTATNCLYNAQMSPIDEGHPSICLYGAQDPLTWIPSVCDDKVDLGVRAKNCAVFCPRSTKEQLKKEFKEELEQMSLPDIAYNYPDMAALLWVLDPEDLKDATDESDVSQDTLTPIAIDELTSVVSLPVVKKPWYIKLLGGE